MAGSSSTEENFGEVLADSATSHGQMQNAKGLLPK